MPGIETVPDELCDAVYTGPGGQKISVVILPGTEEEKAKRLKEIIRINQQIYIRNYMEGIILPPEGCPPPEGELVLVGGKAFKAAQAEQGRR